MSDAGYLRAIAPHLKKPQLLDSEELARIWQDLYTNSYDTEDVAMLISHINALEMFLSELTQVGVLPTESWRDYSLGVTHKRKLFRRTERKIVNSLLSGLTNGRTSGC